MPGKISKLTISSSILKAKPNDMTNTSHIVKAGTKDPVPDRRLIHWPASAPRPTAPGPQSIKNDFYVVPASIVVPQPASGV